MVCAEVARLFEDSTSCSLCQIRQLRFSSRRPCSTESAQREKTVHGQSVSMTMRGAMLMETGKHERLLTGPHAIQVGGIGGINLVDNVGVNCQHVRV